MQEREQNLFFAGIALGILTGLISNLFVTAMYRWVDEVYSHQPSGGSNLITMIIGGLTIIAILSLMLSPLVKRKKTEL